MLVQKDILRLPFYLYNWAPIQIGWIKKGKLPYNVPLMIKLGKLFGGL